MRYIKDLTVTGILEAENLDFPLPTDEFDNINVAGLATIASLLAASASIGILTVTEELDCTAAATYFAGISATSIGVSGVATFASAEVSGTLEAANVETATLLATGAAEFGDAVTVDATLTANEIVSGNAVTAEKIETVGTGQTNKIKGVLEYDTILPRTGAVGYIEAQYLETLDEAGTSVIRGELSYDTISPRNSGSEIHAHLLQTTATNATSIIIHNNANHYGAQGYSQFNYYARSVSTPGSPAAVETGWFQKFQSYGYDGTSYASVFAFGVSCYDVTGGVASVEFKAGQTRIRDTKSLHGEDGVTRGVIELLRGAGSNTMPYIALQDTAGTLVYIFADTSGNVRKHSSVPSSNSDGTALGGGAGLGLPGTRTDRAVITWDSASSTDPFIDNVNARIDSTGNLLLGANALGSAIGVIINSASSQQRRLTLQAAGVTYFDFGVGGANDFSIRRYDNSGSQLGVAMQVTRTGSAGLTIFEEEVRCGTGGTTRGILSALRGASTTPGCMRLQDSAGNSAFLFNTPTGLRFHSALPTSNTDGSKVNVDSYTLQGGFATAHSSPLSSTAYFFGASGNNAWSGPENQGMILVVPRTGTIRACHVLITRAGAASNQTSSMHIRVNMTTDNLVSSTVDLSTPAGSNQIQKISNVSMSVAVTAGDVVSLKWVTPAWGTRPTFVTLTYVLVIEP